MKAIVELHNAFLRHIYAGFYVILYIYMYVNREPK
jgi:hypothetical protein